jgi:hypothetical protein
MIEQALTEYMVNALWQLPLLASGAWLLLRMVRPQPRMQHRVWLAVLALAVLLPVHGMGRTDVLTMQPQHIISRTQENAAWSEQPALLKDGWRPTERPWLGNDAQRVGQSGRCRDRFEGPDREVHDVTRIRLSELREAGRGSNPTVQVGSTLNGSKGTGFSPYIKEARTMGFRFSVGKQAKSKSLSC